MLYLKKLSQTHIDNYISGYYALNIPDNNGIPADWHPKLYWYSFNKDDIVPLYNTNNIFGTEGIEYRKVDNFSCALYKKVYIANHVRAIADLAFTLPNLNELRGCTNDWLKDELQAWGLYNLLLKITNKDIDWFLKEEFSKYHLGGEIYGTISKRQNFFNEKYST